MDVVRALYLEIVSAFESAYPAITPRLCRSILDGLTTGQYYLARDDSGQIVTFCSYWRVNAEDMPLIDAGGRPDNITDGTLVFVVDCFNIVGGKGLSSMIRSLRTANPDMDGAAWWRYRSEDKPKQKRCFPSQKGVRDGWRGKPGSQRNSPGS